MKRLAYNLFVSLGLAAAAPVLAPRLAQKRFRRLAKVRLGLGSGWLPLRQEKGGIWVHALSVGEVASALPLLKALGRAFPGRTLIMSVATDQGYAVAKKALGADSKVLLLVRPLDLPWAVDRLIERLDPGLFCLVEGDIWPNWQWSLAARGVPRMLVNGRVSPRTFKGYRRFAPLARGMLNGFDRILLQTKVDYERMARVGVQPGRLKVGGNLKFDAAPQALTADEKNALALEMGLLGRPVLLAGSTHPGEEGPCLKAFSTLKKKHSDLALILAPRDVGTGEELKGQASQLGLKSVQASLGQKDPKADVVILDVLGKLAAAYALAKAAFVGGSWQPIGGHNLLEPAAQGVPVAYGPQTHNFLEMARELAKAGGGERVKDGADLAAFWDEILADPRKARDMGDRAKNFCLDHQGAVERAVFEARELLKGATSDHAKPDEIKPEKLPGAGHGH